jgi:hypothetical protein
VVGAGLSGAFFPFVPIVGPVTTSSTSRVLFAFPLLAFIGGGWTISPSAMMRDWVLNIKLFVFNVESPVRQPSL